ncbi:MAG: histidine kinase [Clostridia bacterium]|nr:histidine kinase [Clostridia bacterium]
MINSGIHSNDLNKKGKLKIFFGYASGVGKTYAMLNEAQEKLKAGVDVIVGYIEPHTKPETLQLISEIPFPPKAILPPKAVSASKEISFNEYKNNYIYEFDLNAALQRRPELILVDELTHSNADGTRNKKRYQDIEELLNAGIDVYTTLNVQGIESLKDIIQDVIKIPISETIPDYVFDNADIIKLIDTEAAELQKRFIEGKVYRAETPNIDIQNIYTKENLNLLREIALRKAADRVSLDNDNENNISKKTVNIKFLVCIGPSPSSAKCIRWTARIAEAFHSPWIMLYVETPNAVHYNEKQNKNIRNNIELALSLGAKIITLNGYDIASVVSEYAQISGITNIVIGKSRNKKTLKGLFEISLEDKLISKLPDIEIHILPDNDAVKSYKKPNKINWKYNFNLSWIDTLKTLSVLTLMTFMSLELRKLGIGGQNVIIMYILSVLIISRITTGYAFGVIASVLSVLIFNYLFMEPYFNFNLVLPGYPLTLFIMLLVALITSTLMIRIKNQAEIAVYREHKTNVLYELNKKLLKTRGLENIIKLTNEYVSKHFGRSIIFYYEDPANGKPGIFRQSSEDPDSSFMLTPDEKQTAHWVFINKKRAGAGTDTLMEADAFYMPIISQDNVLGVLGISCANGILPDYDNRVFLKMIVSLVAMALERQRLSDEQRDIIIESEKEKMRSNLLRAISHDLRTPLTGILGAGSAILENKNIESETHDKLLSGIVEDSQWLIRMVENLLSVTKITDGSMKLLKTPEAVEEIVGEAAARVKHKLNSCNITVKVPDELLLVPMDGTLIEQVIINLLENAAKHSVKNSPISLIVKKLDNSAVFEVADSGEGLSEQDLSNLFDGYIIKSKIANNKIANSNADKNKSSDSARGMGIGLSICRSIIKAHDGKIEAEKKADGGTIFRFILPIEGEKNNE